MNSIAEIIAAVRPYTGTPDAALECTIARALDAIDSGVPGSLVECGTWLGGSSFAMLLAQRMAYGKILRPVWMYDSFQGMSPPTAEDGRHAAGWWEAARDIPKDKADMEYCVAPLNLVHEAAEALGLEEWTTIRPGWLADTLPVDPPERIAVLRVDCDWYEPVKAVFDHLLPRVAEGGSVIVDDYYAWEGAALATHEWLAAHRAPWPLRSVPGFHGAWFVRGKDTW